MITYSIQLGNALRDRLFTRNDHLFITEGGPVTYEVKPGSEDAAARTWAVHGVCLACKHWSISAGRCNCGVSYRDPALTGGYADRAVQDQLNQAKVMIGSKAT
jgi:hypothetical protein